jgi:AmiR/NasT family two-component response regulator
VNEGAVVTSFMSVALLAAHKKQAAASLRAGLESNREIGKAVGLMMAFHKVDDQAAFDMLRKASQDMNIKLAEVARQFVAHHNSRRP